MQNNTQTFLAKPTHLIMECLFWLILITSVALIPATSDGVKPTVEASGPATPTPTEGNVKEYRRPPAVPDMTAPNAVGPMYVITSPVLQDAVGSCETTVVEVVHDGDTEKALLLNCDDKSRQIVANTVPADVPPTPSVVSPADGSVVDTLIPVLEIDLGVSGVRTLPQIEVSRDPTFGSLDAGVTACGYTRTRFKDLLFRNLVPATKYYWRARSAYGDSCADRENAEWSPWSDVWSFTSGSGGLVLPGPQLVSPENGSTVSDLRPMLEWQPVSGALGFQTHGLNLDYSSTNWGWGSYWWNNTTDTSYEVYRDLEPGATYEWWIQLRNDYAWGEESEHWTLTISTSDLDLALAKKYAPLLWLHSEDPYDPSPVSVMLDKGWLRKSTTGSPATDKVVKSQDLGGADLWGKTADYYLDLGYARYDRPEKHSKHYKDYITQNNIDPMVYARVYRNDTHTVIQYWLFYYYNDFLDKHEGDWEMVQIILEGTGPDPIPVKAGYSRHIRGSKRQWKDVEKAGNHPVVYVAKGSHASYFTHGLFWTPVRSDVEQRPWLDITRADRLVSLAREGRLELLHGESDPLWLDFAGNWGEYFSGCEFTFPLHPINECGPSGPSNQGDKWYNPLNDSTKNSVGLNNVEQAISWFDDLPWDELGPHYDLTTRVSLADCQTHVLSLTDTQERRIAADVNEIDTDGQSAEYIRNCDAGGAGHQTILIHDPSVKVNSINLLPTSALSGVSAAAIQQTQPITLAVNLPDYTSNSVTKADYTDVTVGVSTTGTISVTDGGELSLELDDDGDGVTDQTVNPTTEEAEQDFTAPAIISDLTVTDIVTGAVTLSWTAPGDDGLTGTASLYDLRYYTEPITVSNWVSATDVVSPTLPAAVGTSQTMKVEDLPSGTLHFALRATDEVGNVGDISNSPNAVVISYPQADFNHSCLVDVEDVQDVANRWRLCVGDAGYNSLYDSNMNACIDVIDITQVTAEWGEECN